MAEQTDVPEPRRFGLRDMPGTTIAVTSLVVLGAAALITAPLWLWYRRKRRRADTLAEQAPRTETATSEPPRSSSF